MNLKQGRCEEIALFMLDNKATIREAARQFGMSKTTVHEEVTKHLRDVSNTLYTQIRNLLDANWKDRQRRGGIACHRSRDKT